jgi:hypothetical protein
LKPSDLARQLGVENLTILAIARKIGLDVTENAELTADCQWQIQNALLDQPRQGTFDRPPRMVPATRQRRTGKAPQPSDMASLFLARRDWQDAGYLNPPPRHVQVEWAEEQAAAWGLLLFEAKEAERWLDAIGDLPDVPTGRATLA